MHCGHLPTLLVSVSHTFNSAVHYGNHTCLVFGYEVLSFRLCFPSIQLSLLHLKNVTILIYDIDTNLRAPELCCVETLHKFMPHSCERCVTWTLHGLD
jgi:hypothetical protein